jgi:hypothetical protein
LPNFFLNPKQFTGAVSMNPLDYVLENLYRSREQVVAHPELFEPDSLERIDKAIRYTEEIRAARAA